MPDKTLEDVLCPNFFGFLNRRPVGGPTKTLLNRSKILTQKSYRTPASAQL